MKGLKWFGLVGVALSLAGCGRSAEGSSLSDSLKSKILATQVALRESTSSARGIREAEVDLAERRALADAEAQLHEVAANQAREAEATRQEALERLNPPDPMAGKPASELSSQLAP